jgi:fatty-acyl-CoA synthase
MTAETNLFTLLDRAASGEWHDEPVFHYGSSTRTYGELRERALQVANGLLSLGVGPGDHIAVMLSNRLEWPELLFGIAAMGGICVPVNILLRADEVAYLCDDSDCTVLIADHIGATTLAAAEGLPPLVIGVGTVDTSTPGVTYAYEDVVSRAPATGVPGPRLSDVAMLYYSSGTTGQPKAAIHTHNGILWNAYHQLVDLQLTAADHYLTVPSLSWAAGFNNLVIALMVVGGRSTLMPTGGVTPDRLADEIERGVTHTFLVPTLLKQLLASPAALERIRHTKLRWIVSGAEPVPRPVIEALQKELPGTQVVQGYGMSEFPTIATLLKPEEAIPRVGSACRACAATQLAIRLDDGTIADSGEGEILLRSPATTQAYHNRPEQTAEAFKDGWYHSGDLGRLDEDGYLTITGRKKDMIISGGLNVYPREAEEVIYRLPGIAEAAVVGVPDDRWGEIAVAVIVAEQPDMDPDLILSACREHLAGYKCPRAVLFREEPMPRNNSGKLLKRELRPWAAERFLGAIGQDA